MNIKGVRIFLRLILVLTVIIDFRFYSSAAMSAGVPSSSRIYNVKRFGAKGDGKSDDGPAIQAAIDKAHENGGGIAFLPAGTYLLASVSKDKESYLSLLTPKDNVSVKGAGSKSVIKVAAGMNSLFPQGGGFMVIGERSMLSNAVFSYFTIDENGSQNLLTPKDKRRNNAALFALEGGYHITVDHLTVKNVAGDECIFFPASKSGKQGHIIVKNCLFQAVGSAVPGNYNRDHTSVYLNGWYDHIINNRFISDTLVNGTCFELHGSESDATRNRCVNYSNGFWLAANYEDLTNVKVYQNRFEKMTGGFAFGDNPKYKLGSMEVSDNVFIASPQAKPVFFIAAPCQVCDTLLIQNNKIIGPGNEVETGAIQINYTKRLYIKGNLIKNFGGGAIRAGGSEIEKGYQGDEWDIEGNQFIDCVNVASSSAFSQYLYLTGLRQVRKLTIKSNKFQLSKTGNAGPLYINAPVSTGLITHNQVSDSMRGSMYISPASRNIVLLHKQSLNLDPRMVHAAEGSVWKNASTGDFYEIHRGSVDSWSKAP